MDVLSDVLRDLRLRSAVLSLNELHAPWGFDKPSIAGAAPFHVVVEGSCQFVSSDRKICDLGARDVVIMPHGDPHGLQSENGATRVHFQRLLEDAGIQSAWSAKHPTERLDRRRFGANGAATLILSEIFTFHQGSTNPLLASLPSVIHTRMGSSDDFSGLHRMMVEAEAAQPGFRTITERMAEVLFVQAIRDYAAHLPDGTTGWLRGLTDPHIACVLSLIHEQPQAPWTVASLASKAALSRTVLSNRFSHLVGISVISYLTTHRMTIAADILKATRRPISDIANAVGYESEISFNRAFRRWAGVPPGQYRRNAMQPL